MMIVLDIVVAVLLSLTALLVVLLLIVLIAPLRIILRSETRQYGLQLGPFVSIMIDYQADQFIARGSLLFWRLQRVVFDGKTLGTWTRTDNKASISGAAKQLDKQRTKQQRQISSDAQKRKKSRSIPWRRLVSVLRTFRLRRGVVDLDTGMDEWNAYLYPISYAIYRLCRVQLRPNYDGQLSIDLVVENRVARMVWAFLFPLK